MTYTVTVTSQGQITIPAEIRRELGLDENKKAFVEIEDKKMVLRPSTDILELEGILKDKVKKKVPYKKIREAFGDYLAKHAARKAK